MTTDGARPCHDDLVAREPATVPDVALDGTGVETRAEAPSDVDPAPTAPPPDLAERPDPVLAALARLEAHAMADTERAAARERVIDRQHEEIERLRAERRSAQLRPTVVDLCRLRNDLLRQASSLPTDLSATDVTALLSSYADTIEEALERCGVTVLPSATGTPFVAGQHQVASVVETGDTALDATVAGVVQDGYAEVDGAVVSPARVRIYRYAQKETIDE